MCFLVLLFTIYCLSFPVSNTNQFEATLAYNRGLCRQTLLLFSDLKAPLPVWQSVKSQIFAQSDMLNKCFWFSSYCIAALSCRFHHAFIYICILPARLNCARFCVCERNNFLLISWVSLPLKCLKMHQTHPAWHALGTLFPPHKCFSYCPFVPLQNGVDACETERDTRGPRVHYSPLFSRGEWKITPLCLGRKSLPLTSWLRSVMSKGPKVCAA